MSKQFNVFKKFNKCYLRDIQYFKYILNCSHFKDKLISLSLVPLRSITAGTTITQSIIEFFYVATNIINITI